jgi:hypothetical protein
VDLRQILSRYREHEQPDERELDANVERERVRGRTG